MDRTAREDMEGVVAIEVALHRSASAPDQTGALHDVAGTPGGPVVLWAAAVAPSALGGWLPSWSGSVSPGTS